MLLSKYVYLPSQLPQQYRKQKRIGIVCIARISY